MGAVVPLEAARSYRSRRDYAAEPRVDTKELCRILSVSDSTVKRWRRAGMPFEPWSARLYRYVLSDVLAWHRENV